MSKVTVPAPAPKLGVSELKDAATFIAKVANSAEDILEGGIDARDLFKLPALAQALQSGQDVDLAQVLPQASDLDEVEAADVAAHFKVTLNLTNDTVEAVIEDGLALILKGVAALQDLRAIAAKIKGLIPAA